jgi:hypothetical protein
MQHLCRSSFHKDQDIDRDMLAETTEIFIDTTEPV